MYVLIRPGRFSCNYADYFCFSLSASFLFSQMLRPDSVSVVICSSPTLLGHSRVFCQTHSSYSKAFLLTHKCSSLDMLLFSNSVSPCYQKSHYSLQSHGRAREKRLWRVFLCVRVWLCYEGACHIHTHTHGGWGERKHILVSCQGWGNNQESRNPEQKRRLGNWQQRSLVQKLIELGLFSAHVRGWGRKTASAWGLCDHIMS